MATLGVFVLAFSAIAVLYAINLVQWGRWPDFGWSLNYNLSRMVLTEVHGAAEQAGLRAGDVLLRVNGVGVTAIRQVQDNLIRQPSGENSYLVMRPDGSTLTVRVPITPLGLRHAVLRYGLTFVLGVVFFCMGAVVFLMTPGTRPPWAFLLMMFIAGLYISFTFTSKLSPSWLSTVFTFATAFLPAAVLHLTQVFPLERSWVQAYRWVLWLPYLLAAVLFGALRSWGPAYTDVPILWRQMTALFLAGAFVLFLGSTLSTYVQSASPIARTRALVILIGSGLALLLPLADMFTTLFWNRPLLATAVLNLPCFVFFPLSIGYAIAKHDLFAIDRVVRRTCGYILSTASIVAVYMVVVSLLNLILQEADVANSPFFSLAFALAVVFVFGPLHRRLQGWIDRLFYRQSYDYRKTIRDTSEAMIRILDEDRIAHTLIDSVVRGMALDNGTLLLQDPTTQTYVMHASVGSEAVPLSVRQLSTVAPLVQALRDKREALLDYELEVDPRYADQRAVLQETFQTFAAALMLPLQYKDELRGIIAFGRKKSGRMFTPEDLDLLATMANQSAIAMENAKLFAENIEKSRMEEELKIAHDIQISMLPERAPRLAGVTIAARSIPAREVGGDFYDFIEVQGDGTNPRLAIVVGDVSGKAVSGALVMAASRSVFRVLAETHSAVEDVMAVGNARLQRDIKKGMFVALLYAVLDPHHKTLTLANAGQTQPILCARDGTAPVYLDTTGDSFPLGIVKKSRYSSTCVPLRSGDTVVLYTDGIVEAMNAEKQLYGFERLMAAIASGRELPPEALVQRLIDDVADYAGGTEQHDDLTLVVVQVE